MLVAYVTKKTIVTLWHPTFFCMWLKKTIVTS